MRLIKTFLTQAVALVAPAAGREVPAGPALLAPIQEKAVAIEEEDTGKMHKDAEEDAGKLHKDKDKEEDTGKMHKDAEDDTGKLQKDTE